MPSPYEKANNRTPKVRCPKPFKDGDWDGPEEIETDDSRFKAYIDSKPGSDAALVLLEQLLHVAG